VHNAPIRARARLADRMSLVATSPTMKVAAEAERLRRAGADIVDLGVGEPDFPTPAHVKSAAITAIERNLTRYTSNAGVLELKQAVCERMRTDYQVALAPDEVIITAGGKQALYNAALAILQDGDEAITHAPGWPTLVEQIRLAGATPIVVRTHPDDGFRLHAESVVGAFTTRTRAVVLNSPCNPTGALVTERDLAAIADAAAARGVWIIVDLCYEHLIYDVAAHNLPGILFARMRDRTVLCGSASKAYAMTGWRCGWMIAAPDVIEAANALQSHQTSNVSSITQQAAIAALAGPREAVERMRDEYRERRDRLMDWLAPEPRIRCLRPAGAFYLFLDISSCLSPDTLRTSEGFAQALLDEKAVAVTPGEAFDAPGFVRVSYAAAPHRLKEGARRLLEFVAEHAP